MAKEKVLGEHKKKVAQPQSVFVQKQDEDDYSKRRAEQERAAKFYYLKNHRDRLAEIALPNALKGSVTLESAVITAYKVADLMLAESDKFKP